MSIGIGGEPLSVGLGRVAPGAPRANDVQDDVDKRSASLKAPSTQTVTVATGATTDEWGLGGAKQSLDRALGLSDAAIAVGRAVVAQLEQLSAFAEAARADDIDAGVRDQLNEEFVALRDGLAGLIEGAEVDGASLLDGSLSVGLTVLTGGDQDNTITIQAFNLTFSGPILGDLDEAEVSTADAAETALAAVRASLAGVRDVLAGFEADAKRLDTQNSFITTLLEALGDGVDGELSADGARLEALNAQQLLAQGPSIANAAPSTILTLFRS